MINVRPDDSSRLHTMSPQDSEHYNCAEIKLRKRPKGIKEACHSLQNSKAEALTSIWLMKLWERGKEGGRGDISFQHTRSTRKCLIQHHLHRWDEMLISVLLMTPHAVCLYYLSITLCFQQTFSQFLEKGRNKINRNNNMEHIQQVLEVPWTPINYQKRKPWSLKKMKNQKRSWVE